MDLHKAIVTKLNEAFADDNSPYAVGFCDALESFTLALQGTIPDGLLMDALQTALDAYSNNVDEDFEDDGQPDERQEWHDYDPEC